MKRLYLTPEEKDYPEREHALKENGKEREQVKWMVKDGLSARRIIQYLHRWCLWWVRTAADWSYQNLLLWFIDACWDEPTATYAAGLHHRHMAKSFTSSEKLEIVCQHSLNF